MTLAREITFLLGLLLCVGGIWCWDYRAGMVTCGVLLSGGAAIGMHNGRNR